MPIFFRKEDKLSKDLGDVQSDVAKNRISLLDIINIEQERQKNVDREDIDALAQLNQETQLTYKVDNPNPYAVKSEKSLSVGIKLLNVMFDGQVCSLVHMQDLTKFDRENEVTKNNEDLSMTNAWINEEIRGNQNMIMALTG